MDPANTTCSELPCKNGDKVLLLVLLQTLTSSKMEPSQVLWSLGSETLLLL